MSGSVSTVSAWLRSPFACVDAMAKRGGAGCTASTAVSGVFGAGAAIGVAGAEGVAAAAAGARNAIDG